MNAVVKFLVGVALFVIAIAISGALIMFVVADSLGWGYSESFDVAIGIAITMVVFDFFRGVEKEIRR